MTALFECALTNAVLAIPLALLAAATTAARRPALTHALWLLVLLRLFAPPVWHLPMPSWSAAGPGAALQGAPSADAIMPFSLTRADLVITVEDVRPPNAEHVPVPATPPEPQPPPAAGVADPETPR